ASPLRLLSPHRSGLARYGELSRLTAEGLVTSKMSGMTANRTPQPQPSLTMPTTALNILLVVVIANFTLQPVTEPDFGWHLRAGLDMLGQGWAISRLDPYSHTMPDWVWIEHAWLTDVFMAVSYRGFGLLGVIVLFGIVAAGAWLIASYASKCVASYRLIATALSLWVALPFLGARTQMVTLLGLAGVVFLLERFGDGDRRVLWAIPPLFMLWANLHGGVTSGLFFLFFVLVGSLVFPSGCARLPTLR